MKRLACTLAVAALTSTLAYPKGGGGGGELQLIAFTQASSIAGYSSVTHSLGGNYQSPTRAPAGAAANVTVPAGLGVGPLVPLNITNVEGKDLSGSGKMIHYWGCSPTILKGQPEVVSAAHKGTGKVVQGGSSGNTDPTKMMAIPEGAKLAGGYAFKISYLGDVQVPMSDKQEFLGALNITEPANPQAVDVSAAVKVSWTTVPNALGYSVMAAGKNAKGETVYWENEKDATGSWYIMGVVGAVKAGKLHNPQQNSCTIPAGIFAGPVSLTVNGYSQEVKGSGALNAWGWAQTAATTMLGPMGGKP